MPTDLLPRKAAVQPRPAVALRSQHLAAICITLCAALFLTALVRITPPTTVSWTIDVGGP